MRTCFFIFVSLAFINISTIAQTTHQNSGWLFLMNSTKINNHWGTHLDVQLRTQDEWDGIRNILIRPGVTYFFNNNNDLTLGYLFTNTFTQLVGTPDNTLTEHRIWQQFIHKHKISSIGVSHRLRLEQRFMERRGEDDLFSQRLRYFIRLLMPLQKSEQAFDKGFFAALQNETFFNIQNKSELNNSLFDQNRAYIAAGYRFSKQLDMEAGYMNQAVKGAGDNTNNNVIQLAIYTRF